MALQRGFSLIEAMVGITVGLIAVLVISQTFMSFETRKQTTTAGADAQENGLMAMTMIEQDARNAGAGLAAVGVQRCTSYFSYYDPGTGGGPIPAFNTAAVTITDGGAAGSDSITFRTGAFLGSVPAYLSANVAAGYDAGAALPVDRDARVGMQNADLVLVTDEAGNCVLLQVDVPDPHAPAPPPKLLTLRAGSPFNPPAAYQASASPPWPALNAGATVYDIGKGDGTGAGFATRSYSVNAQQLRVTNTQLGVLSSTQDLVRNVVSLQARYGVANAGEESVNAWVDATGGWAGGAITAADARRIKAVQVVVATRSERREADEVSSDAWFANEVPDAGLRDAVRSSIQAALPDPEWKHYRYKIYGTIVPLRNVLWPDIK
ncbi:MAG: hypothetical protein OHK0026_13520 [Rhodocyclaceae bacterium]